MMLFSLWLFRLKNWRFSTSSSNEFVVSLKETLVKQGKMLFIVSATRRRKGIKIPLCLSVSEQKRLI